MNVSTIIHSNSVCVKHIENNAFPLYSTQHTTMKPHVKTHERTLFIGRYFLIQKFFPNSK